MIEVLIDDLVTPLLQKMEQGVDVMMSSLVRDESEAILPFVKQRTPIGQHFDFYGNAQAGGRLRSSLHFTIGMYGAYLAGAEYGKFVLGGTRAHEIRPKVKSALAFYWAKIGRGVVRARVMHPGTQANDFRQHGLQEAFDTETVQQVAQRIQAQWLNGEL